MKKVEEKNILMDISIALIQFEDIADVTLGGRHKEMLIGRHQFPFALLHSLLRRVKQTRNILCSNRF